jgi:hypothetical protein
MSFERGWEEVMPWGQFIREFQGYRDKDREWRPGDRILIEHDLVAQYQCSRMKVSKALSILV